MDSPINLARVQRALSKLEEAKDELEMALAEAAEPRPDPPPRAAKIKDRRSVRSLRRRL
jgi:hypothetical protein